MINGDKRLVLTCYITYTKFYHPTVFQSRDMDPSLLILKHLLLIRSLKRDNINNLCLCLK